MTWFDNDLFLVGGKPSANSSESTSLYSTILDASVDKDELADSNSNLRQPVPVRICFSYDNFTKPKSNSLSILFSKKSSLALPHCCNNSWDDELGLSTALSLWSKNFCIIPLD